MTALPTIYITRYDRLIHSDLGGGIGFTVTSSFIYRYRAFRRCQSVAQAEGSVRLCISLTAK